MGEFSEFSNTTIPLFQHCCREAVGREYRQRPMLTLHQPLSTNKRLAL
jgi:hypothetical protein